jgi:hypothetical protein
MHMQNELTEDEMKELSQEPGEVTDIGMNIPPMNKLHELKQIIDKTPRDQVMEFFETLLHGANWNIINPNDNNFSSISEKEIIKYKVREKIKKKRIEEMIKKYKEDGEDVS